MTSRKNIMASLALAGFAFYVLFAGAAFHFWAQMSLTVGGLVILSGVVDREGFKRLRRRPERGWTRTILYGAASAVILYAVFYCGKIATGFLMPFSSHEISVIYDFKGATSAWVIAALLACIIGPGEEIFWRNYIQRQLEERYGRLMGASLAVAAYTGVHLASGNLTLVLASLVCGMFWSFLFLRYKSAWMNIISHVVWDVSVFLILPFG